LARKKQLPRDARIAVTELDAQGCGRGRGEGMEVRVWGALPGETASVRVLKRRRNQLEAIAETVAGAHPDRIDAACPYSARCGGCALQHLAPPAQRDFKRRRLQQLLVEAGAGTPARWLSDLAGPGTGYRRKARLGVRCVPAKGGVLVGFRERGSSRVAEVAACRTLAPEIGTMLAPLRRMVAQLSVAHAVPQLEIAVGDDGAVIVMRHLEPLTPDDEAVLRNAGERLGFRPWLQSGGPATVRPLDADAPRRLHYALPAFGLRMAFHPLDFTQVNAAVNRSMIEAALELLAPEPDDHVLDLFCGLGNFTLPLASRCKEVHGVEGSEALVARARENAAANGIDGARFEVADLYGPDLDVTSLPRAERLLLDPPRSGAERICSHMSALAPRRIVYVSCNPETLARDAALLCGAGYAFSAAGIIDMFPHTAHVESMAVFDRLAGS
jgi:23S rRNA (uracil1939-C5)-methyltransferase